MPRNIRNIAAALGIVIAAAAIYFGSYLPLVKSRLFIKSLQTASSVKTIDQFRSHFDTVFNFYSPVGDEEVAKFLSSDILNIVASGKQTEAASRVVVEYIEPHMFKDNVRHLLSVGMMYENLWLRYGKNDADYAKAEGYYRAALAIGPKLPPVLYSLANLYNEKGDVTKGREIKAMILNLWPNEGNIVNFFN